MTPGGIGERYPIRAPSDKRASSSPLGRLDAGCASVPAQPDMAAKRHMNVLRLMRLLAPVLVAIIGCASPQPSATPPTSMPVSPSPAPAVSPSLGFVVDCHFASRADCDAALPAVSEALRGVDHPVAHLGFATGMLCRDPIFLDGPIAGLCVVSPPPDATQGLGHATVTFGGTTGWAYLNIWKGRAGVGADLIAVRSRPAFWDSSPAASPSSR